MHELDVVDVTVTVNPHKTSRHTRVSCADLAPASPDAPASPTKPASVHSRSDLYALEELINLFI